MFRGLTAVNLDGKGRMAMPARYRPTLENDAKGLLVVTIDTEQRCLLLYPFHQWEIIEAKLEALSSFNPVTRRIQRLLMGHATELEMDAQGRLLLPTLLREYAGLDRCVMLVGQGKKFEIWGETQWQQKREDWIKEELGDEERMPDELRTLSL
jgi:MraZ protein